MGIEFGENLPASASPGAWLERRVEHSPKVPEINRLVEHQGLHLRDAGRDNLRVTNDEIKDLTRQNRYAQKGRLW